MWDDFRRHPAHLLATGAQVSLLFAGMSIESPWGWYVCLSLIALISLVAWLSAMQRARLFTDTPMSSIATAAQGQVRLQGQGMPLGGLPLHAPLTGLPCLWFRRYTERKEDDRWVSDHRDESVASFLVDDGTGTCVLDPEGADMQVSRKSTWEEGDYRHTLWTILERDAIQAVGYFRTDSTSHVDASPSAAVSELLTQWKEDRATLLKRFDLNEDGEIDLKEWELVRAQARREVEKARQQAILEHRAVHFMGKAKDGRPCIISTFEAKELVRRYAFWTWLQAGIFLASLAGLTGKPW